MLPTRLLLPVVLPIVCTPCSGLLVSPGGLIAVRSTTGAGALTRCVRPRPPAGQRTVKGEGSIDRSAVAPNREGDAEFGSGIDAGAEGGEEDSILEELEDLARLQSPQGPLSMERKETFEPMHVARSDPVVDDDYPSISTTGVPWIAAGALGGAACFVWAIFVLLNNNGAHTTVEIDVSAGAGGGAASDDFLDWKDLVAYTAGEAFSSVALRAALYVGELSLLRSVFRIERDVSGTLEMTGTQRGEGYIGPPGDGGGIIEKIISWVEEQGDEMDDVDWTEIIADVCTWVLYSCLKDDSPVRGVAAIDSATESAALGLVSSSAALLLTEVVVARTSWLSFAESSKENILRRDGQQSISLYAKTGLSASALFFVYDLVLGVLEGGTLLKSTAMA